MPAELSSSEHISIYQNYPFGAPEIRREIATGFLSVVVVSMVQKSP